MAEFSLKDKWIITHISLLALLLLEARHGDTAPTHHLTVSVEGNTPTLIVTSAEIGITPKILNIPLATPMTTPISGDDTQSHIEGFDIESNGPKLKAKSHKFKYNKKWHNAIKYREKSKSKISSSKEDVSIATTTSNAEVSTQSGKPATTLAPIIQALAATTSITSKSTPLEGNTLTTNLPEVNIISSSVRTLALQTDSIVDKPSQVDTEPNVQDVINTAGVMSTISGNLPQSTEPTTTVALAPTKAAEHTKNTNISGVTILDTEQITLPSHVAVEKMKAEQDKTTSTMTPKFMDLPNMTAKATTKQTTTITASITATLMKTAKKPIKKTTTTTTANAPMIKNQIETLPKAITVSLATTTIETPLKRTNTFVTNNNANIAKIYHPVKTSTITTSESSISGSGSVDVNQKDATTVTITSTSTYTSNPPIINRIIKKVCSNNSDNLQTTPIPQTKNKVIEIEKVPTKANVMSKSTKPIVQSTSTFSSKTTTTTTIENTPPTTAISLVETTKQTKQNSSFIFIDNVPDNRGGDKQNETSAEFQNDDAAIIVGQYGDDDGVNDSKDIIKLIDLEKHDLKSIERAKKYKINNIKNNTSDFDDNDDGGHDGVKRTRKKQLIDKHYLPSIGINERMKKIAIITTTPPPLGKEFSVEVKNIFVSLNEGSSNEEIRNNEDLLKNPTPKVKGLASLKNDTKKISQFAHSQPNKEKSTTAKVELKPVHNGYLGPIVMEEKRFSVLHEIKNKHEHHEHTIESKLRDGRLVEIIAPAALLEQSSTTTSPLSFNIDSNNFNTHTTTKAPARATFHSSSVQHSAPVLSTTVFQVLEKISNTTGLPLHDGSIRYNDEKSKIYIQKQNQQTLDSLSKNKKNEETESKISDIQVEVYDSTVDSIIASTNFKDNDGFYEFPIETEPGRNIGTTKPPVAQQERFTQYVVDRVDYATQESSAAPVHGMEIGKPEPAAIEIHINVSEGIGNESEDLEFSYRQPDFGSGSSKAFIDEDTAEINKMSAIKPPVTGSISSNNQSNNQQNNDRGDEILVVEIIDTGENNTETAMSADNINPIFTFRSDPETDVELKDIKYFSPEVKVKPPQMSDELFLADMKRENSLPKPPLPPLPPPPRKPTIDRDSDTIFYISNTEVKVGESLPTINSNFEQQQQLRKTKLENQFFPANYLASTHPNAAKIDEKSQPRLHRYEEDIILSPLANTADSLKIFRSQGDGAPPLDVTYVGESVMEVEQSSGAGATTTISASVSPSLMPDVIIQPAILPEMSIGVPVIGELPPQIELKEIDFMPDEAYQLHSGIYENNILEESGNGNGNEVDRIVESSVQYGGDLIDENAGGGGFDGVEGSYPFGNPTALHNKDHHATDYTHFIVNHGVNNLRKDELSADVAGFGDITVGQPSEAAAPVVAPAAVMLNNLENGELKELLESSANETLPSLLLRKGSYTVTEYMNNVTVNPVLVDQNKMMFEQYSMIIIILFGLLLFVLVSCGFCCLWVVYIKYHQLERSPGDNKANRVGRNISGNGKSDAKDISRVARETTMHYNTSEKDGVFVVEVARGIDSKSISGSPTTEEPRPICEAINASSTVSKEDEKVLKNHEEIQIHRPPPESSLNQQPISQIEEMPERSLHQIVELDEPSVSPNSFRAEETSHIRNSNTGLSQSDLSSTSSNGSNKRYSYGNQELYTVEPTCYMSSSPCRNFPTVLDSANNATEEDDDRRSENGHSLANSPAAEVNATAAANDNQVNRSQLTSDEQTNEQSIPDSVKNETEEDDDQRSDNGHRLAHSPASLDTLLSNNISESVIDNGLELSSPEAKFVNSDDENSVKGSVQNRDDENEEDIEEVVKLNGEVENEMESVTTEDIINTECISNNNNAVKNLDADVDSSETESNDNEVTLLSNSIKNKINEKNDDTIDTKTELINGGNSAHLSYPQSIVSNYGYDSIISLPDPPSTEEIKQLADFTIIENNQLDSLPPPSPPPPPITSDLNENTASNDKDNNITTNNKFATEEETTATNQLKLKQILDNDITNTTTTDHETKMPANANNNNTDNTNGNILKNGVNELDVNGHIITHGHDNNIEILTAHSELNIGENTDTPLTPPASPPLSSPVHYTTTNTNTISGINGVNRGICNGSLPVAVNVNGS